MRNQKYRAATRAAILKSHRKAEQGKLGNCAPQLINFLDGRRRVMDLAISGDLDKNAS
jgi:hypothetical protein